MSEDKEKRVFPQFVVEELTQAIRVRLSRLNISFERLEGSNWEVVVRTFGEGPYQMDLAEYQQMILDHIKKQKQKQKENPENA